MMALIPVVGIDGLERKGRDMAFKFKDLIVTLVPHGGTHGDCDSTSGGCAGTCDAGSGGTVGSCTSECGGHPEAHGACGQSDEVLNPIALLIDPPYLAELRLLLRFAVAQSSARKVAALESHMQPHTVKEVDLLESHFKEALSELGHLRTKLQNTKR